MYYVVVTIEFTTTRIACTEMRCLAVYQFVYEDTGGLERIKYCSILNIMFRVMRRSGLCALYNI